MSADISCAYGEMATNDFVDNLKSLSLSQTADAYSTTMTNLLIQLTYSTPNGLMENLPFAMALVDNLHRVIPIFDKKLLDDNENAHQIQLFLKTLYDSYGDLCLLKLFLEIKDSRCLTSLFNRYTPLLKKDYFTDDGKYDNLVNCLLPIIVYTIALISVNESQLPPDLLSVFLEFAKQHWQSKERQSVIQNIFIFLKVASKTPALVPMIIRCGWPNACIQWLKTSGPRPSYKTDFYISLLLQKLARHTAAVQTLNQLDCIKAFDECKEQMKKDHDKEEYATINFIQCITYTLLMEAGEIKQNSILADKLVCEVLDQLVSYTLKAAGNLTLFYNGCHISDVLCVLSKLFVNDDILNKCLRDNAKLFDCLCQLHIELASSSHDISQIHKIFKDEAFLTLTNLIWSISFHEAYHEKFKSNVHLMQTLSNLATSSSLYTNQQVKTIPRDIFSLKKAAEGILWNLKSSQVTPTKDKSEEQPHIMISYSHSDSKFCRELVEHLSNYVPVWVDYEQTHGSNHSDDLWEEIAGAMEMATAIILIVSKEYYDSKSCRQELSYASDTLKKRIVPVYAPDKQFKASGWLGIRIAGQKYIHFGRKRFADAATELLTMIAADRKAHTVTNPPRKMKEEDNSIHNWTSKDIRKWFDDNHIHNDLIELFADQFHTGTALLVYAHHLKQFYRNEYVQILANYSRTFHGKRLQTVDFVTFVDALWRLREKYDPQSKIENTSDKRGGDQLSCAMKFLKDGMTWL